MAGWILPNGVGLRINLYIGDTGGQEIVIPVDPSAGASQGHVGDFPGSCKLGIQIFRPSCD